MEFKRTITKEGIKTIYGELIPSPFIFKGNITGIDVANNRVGFKGLFKTDINSLGMLVIQGKSPDPKNGVITELNGRVEQACNISNNGLTHDIDESKLLLEVDKMIASKLGLDVTDIS